MSYKQGSKFIEKLVVCHNHLRVWRKTFWELEKCASKWLSALLSSGMHEQKENKTQGIMKTNFIISN